MAKPIEVAQKFAVSRSRLWRAITDSSEMRNWFFDHITQFEATKGFRTEFEVYSEERKFTHQWQILEAIPEEKIVYDWRYKEYDGRAKVIFKLNRTKGGSEMFVTNLGLETFPDDVPEF